MQMPETTLVAGYKAWQKNLGRHVIKGKGAIRIFAPSPYIYKDKAVMRKLDSLVGDFPDTYKLVEQDEISKTYSLSKSYISYRKPRAISTEQRERARRMMIRQNKAKREDN